MSERLNDLLDEARREIDALREGRDAAVLAEREAWQRATGCANPETIDIALARIGALAERTPTEGIPDAIERIKRERAVATLAEREACAKLADAHVGTGSHATADAAAAIRARK